jgi:arginyl-tRNA synthetase
LLLKWESGDPQVRALWEKMNGWVYDGFEVTYKSMGVDFDKYYYESNTYLLGKEVIQEGLDKKVFYKKDNGSIAIDLSADGLDEKIVLRSDGTSVYITQDLGTAIERFRQFPQLNQLIYTVGNEQDYHFKVLFKTLERLGYGWAKECYHLSYGMVELPEGKMKSREGTVVDADDLLQEMLDTAAQTTRELGKVEGFSDDELNELYKTVGMGALKYFILKVDPKKKMLFDPKESIDFNGNTGPFIQYTHARIRSVLRKAAAVDFSHNEQVKPLPLERLMIRTAYDFADVVAEAGRTYSPSVIANYLYEVAKLYNRFYHELTILGETDASKRNFRLQLSDVYANLLKNGMRLLGISVPDKM